MKTITTHYHTFVITELISNYENFCNDEKRQIIFLFRYDILPYYKERLKLSKNTNFETEYKKNFELVNFLLDFFCENYK